MRIPSGKTDAVIYFVAVDSVDYVTRKTGLATFTVYRSRNNGTATIYTTPTVTELSAANMPGVYSVLIDEDTTIAATSDSEEVCLHITHAGMAPVTRTFELYRRDTTTGRTLDVSTGGEAGVDWANVGSPTTSLALTGTTIATTQKVDVETIKTNPVVNAGTVTFPTTATLASTTNITGGTITTTTNLTNLPAITANWLTAAGTAADFGAEMATAIWTDTTAGDFTTDLSIGKTIVNGVTLGTGLTINAYTGNTVQTGDSFGRIGVTGSGLTSLATQASVDVIDDFLDTEVAAIKTTTDKFVFTVANEVNANTRYISGAAASADNLERSTLGIVLGTVGAASTTTSIVTSSLDPAAAVTDQFKGRIVTFDRATTTANLRGQSTDITASTAAGVLTCTALTTAPVSGDTFVIT